jgi:hypothetical protein
MIQHRRQLLTFPLLMALVACGGGGSGADDNSANSAANKSLERNPLLVGTWRFTEVLSSGGFFLSTDFFFEFAADGTSLFAVGSSAGGSQNSSLVNRDKGDVTQKTWHTVGSELILTDPKTQETETFGFVAEANRLLLKGQENRVYERIR